MDKLGSFMQTKHPCVLIHIWPKGEVGALWNRFKPSSKIFVLTVPKRYFFCGSLVLFMSCVCHAFAPVHCCLMVTWREMADLSALVCEVLVWFIYFPIWYPGTGLVLSCIDSWSLLSFLLWYDLTTLLVTHVIKGQFYKGIIGKWPIIPL